jgi:hypothetical protein
MATKTHDEMFAEVIRQAAPSAGLLRAWPTLSRAADLIERPLSTLTRAMTSDGTPRYRLGRRDKKVAPVAVLHYARVYGADVDHVAAALVDDAEKSGTDAEFVESVERDVSAWMEGRARAARVRTTAPTLEDLVAVVQRLSAPEQAEQILRAAGIKD